MSARRTIRRFAHELYPHPDEYEIRPLAVEVPYLYARFVGLSVFETGWFEADWRDDEWAHLATGQRTLQFIGAARTALLADALQQGMTGDKAWAWAESRVTDDMGVAYDRAVFHGVPIDEIKPYPCGPEPDHHNHKDDPAPGGGHFILRVAGKESECEECTEPVEGGEQP